MTAKISQTPLEQIALSGPAGRLEAVLRTVAEPRRAAVVSHPHPLYGGSMDNLVVREAEAAFGGRDTAVLRYNFRGVGASEGEHDGGVGEMGDLRAAIDSISARYPELPLFLVGYSFGAIVTLTLLAQSEPPPRLAGVLLLAPPVSYFNGSNWSTAGRPAAIVYGSEDELTPEARMREVAVNIGTGVLREKIPGAGHDLATFHDPSRLRAALGRCLDGLALL